MTTSGDVVCIQYEHSNFLHLFETIFSVPLSPIHAQSISSEVGKIIGHHNSVMHKCPIQKGVMVKTFTKKLF